MKIKNKLYLVLSVGDLQGLLRVAKADSRKRRGGKVSAASCLVLDTYITPSDDRQINCLGLLQSAREYARRNNL